MIYKSTRAAFCRSRRRGSAVPITMKRSAICGAAVALSTGLAFGAADPTAPLQIGHRLELFIDRYLIAELHNATLRLGQPRREEIVLRFDQPWEGPFAGALGVIQDKDVY